MKYSEQPIHVVIADDHDVYRDGLYMLLEKCAMIKVIGQAGNGKELISIVQKYHPDIVITDLRMPVIDGVEATRRLTIDNPSVRIIALSMFDDENLVINALEAGALGYLLKNASRNEIIEAVRTVRAGLPYYCRSTSVQFARRISSSEFNPYRFQRPAEFNDKEKRIINLVCDERSSKEIADVLYMNTRTVERIRSGILEKMNVKNSAGIAIYAIKNDLYKT